MNANLSSPPCTGCGKTSIYCSGLRDIERRKCCGSCCHDEPLGSDGLTDRERQTFLASFRAGPGSKP